MKTEIEKISELEKYFINNATSVTNKKLQKLLYFAQAWFVTLYNDEEEEINNRLFDDKVEGWRHGPVIPESYYNYKENAFKAIPRVGEYINNFEYFFS